MGSFNTEVQEAIMAGERALSSLNIAQEYLRKASNWGLWDLFGGGMISGFMKHKKIDDAKYYLDKASYDIQAFNKEVRDVNQYVNLQIEVSDLLTLADFFFDGFIADMMVQSKIKKARYQVEEAIMRINCSLEILRKQLY